jgi:hypothetical protein
MAEQTRGAGLEDKEEANQPPSRPKANDPAAVSKRQVRVTSNVPEKAKGQLNPSSPADTGTTPGSNASVG